MTDRFFSTGGMAALRLQLGTAMSLLPLGLTAVALYLLTGLLASTR